MSHARQFAGLQLNSTPNRCSGIIKIFQTRLCSRNLGFPDTNPTGNDMDIATRNSVCIKEWKFLNEIFSFLIDLKSKAYWNIFSLIKL